MKRFLLFIPVLVLFVACESDNELTVLSQEDAIDKYILGNFPENEVVRSNGSNRVIISQGVDNASVAKGDSVTMIIEGYVFDGAPTKLFLQDSVKVSVTRSEMVQGLYDGIIGADLYEQSLIIFSSRYGYYDEQVGIIPSMSALMYNVLITDIK